MHNTPGVASHKNSGSCVCSHTHSSRRHACPHQPAGELLSQQEGDRWPQHQEADELGTVWTCTQVKKAHHISWNVLDARKLHPLVLVDPGGPSRKDSKYRGVAPFSGGRYERQSASLMPWMSKQDIHDMLPLDEWALGLPVALLLPSLFLAVVPGGRRH